MKHNQAFGVALFALACLVASPAFAGTPVPGPEDGAGVAALGLIGAGYVYLKNRLKRR